MIGPAASIVHLTSAHPRYDTRIFLKQCRSLARAGHGVSLLVADGKGDEERDGVAILDVGASRGRLDRMLRVTRRLLARARALDADLYHLHDPELLPVGLALKRRGKQVIFDAHEDLPRQILSKPYLHRLLRRPIAAAAEQVQSYACGRLDAVIAATPSIRDSFTARGIDVVDINNFPMLGELEADLEPGSDAASGEVCYVGGITAIRGIREVVAALELSTCGARLNLGGTFAEAGFAAEMRQMPGWSQVNELGFLTRGQVREVLGRSVAGLVTLHSTPAYLRALPVKMFEYMSAGLPVIASDFPLWREIVLGNECGLCVDPGNPEAIAKAIDRLVSDRDLARRLGENGRRAVVERYNWAVEERKLLALYDAVLARSELGPP